MKSYLKKNLIFFPKPPAMVLVIILKHNHYFHYPSTNPPSTQTKFSNKKFQTQSPNTKPLNYIIIINIIYFEFSKNSVKTFCWVLILDSPSLVLTVN